MFGPIFHTQFVDNDTCDLSDYACVDGSANYPSQVLHVAYLPTSGSYFSRCLLISSLNVAYRCDYSLVGPTPWYTATTPGTGLLLDRSVAVPKVGDYSWHGTTPGP